MFLNILNNEEKEDFLNLLINIANVDGDFNDLEKEQINVYVLEMGLSLKEKDQYKKKTKELIEFFSKSTIIVKKAIFVEIIALMIADGMQEEETVLLNEIQKAFDFDDKFKNEAIQWYNEILPLYRKGFQLVGATS